ncbi:hypothetical protein DFJ74DRAFT_706899 [Hyaloraphidium curvatum]|nr:hypothetical protein DFJ74DRAFT_706899 [Hyaloraphidium curvatum]
MSRLNALRLDASDTYNRGAKHVLLPLVIAYVVVAASSRHTYEAGKPDSGPPLRYTAPDGLRLALSAPFPDSLLQLHRFCGIALLLLVLAQKHLTVPALARAGPGSRSLHALLGYLAILCMAGMASAGFLMRDRPAYSDFGLAMWLFFVPWPVIALAVLAAARAGKWELHALAGNVALRACLAVPAARVAGAYLQARGEAGEGWLVEQWGYYVGIGAITAVVGLWTAWDAWRWWQDMAKPVPGRKAE